VLCRRATPRCTSERSSEDPSPLPLTFIRRCAAVPELGWLRPPRLPESSSEPSVALNRPARCRESADSPVPVSVRPRQLAGCAWRVGLSGRPEATSEGALTQRAPRVDAVAGEAGPLCADASIKLRQRERTSREVRYARERGIRARCGGNTTKPTIGTNQWTRRNKCLVISQGIA
jgi:hypothetical protein